LDFENLAKSKTVLVLLVVIVLNIAVFVLLGQLNAFVHGDLYNYGLVFSYGWAAEVWYYNLLVWSFLIGATVLAFCAIIPHYLHSKGASGFSKLFGFLLPVLALVYQGLSIFYLSQMDSAVRTLLFNYGIPSSFDWSVTYDPIVTATYVLMVISLIAFIIPAVRSLEIVKIEVE
jgi:hypothetical protein